MVHFYENNGVKLPRFTLLKRNYTTLYSRTVPRAAINYHVFVRSVVIFITHTGQINYFAFHCALFNINASLTYF